MPGLINLPAYQTPNALNFQPLNDAIDGVRKNALMQQQIALQERGESRADRADSRAERQLGLVERKYLDEAEQAKAKQAGGLVTHVMNLPADQQDAAWQHILATQPGFRDLPADKRDFRVIGPQMLTEAAKYGYRDPATVEKDRAELDKTRAMTDHYRAEAEKARKPDPIDQLLRGFTPGQQPPTPATTAPPASSSVAPGVSGTPFGAPNVRPQSYAAPDAAPRNALMPVVSNGALPPPIPGQGADVQPARNALAVDGPQYNDPNIVSVQSGPQPPRAAPTPSHAAPSQRMVQTAIGPLSVEQAEFLGFGLALKGRGDAGKMLTDAAGKLPKHAGDKNDERELNAVEHLARLKGIKAAYKPEYQTMDEQLKQYGVSWLDSIGPLRDKIPKEAVQQHYEYTQYRQEAYANLNNYIKEITGSAMGLDEGKRIRKAMPDPEKDGPTQFEAKLNGAIQQAQMAVARYRYLRTNGFNGQPWAGTAEDAARALPLDRMPKVIQGEADRVTRALKMQYPQATDEQLKGPVRAELKKRFGLDI